MKAVLFDFNGTLYNDTEFHRAAWRNFMKRKFDMDLTEEEISYFRDMVVRVADQVGSIKTRPDRLDSIGREALNKRLGTFMCPYRLARGAWRIERAVEATEA